MDYLSTKETALLWGISERRVQKLCESNRVPGVRRLGKAWAIPKGALKPEDARRKGLTCKQNANEKV